jgi:hypothetical protein
MFQLLIKMSDSMHKISPARGINTLPESIQFPSKGIETGRLNPFNSVRNTIQRTSRIHSIPFGKRLNTHPKAIKFHGEGD